MIFSPTPFVKAVEEHANDALPRQLSFEYFNEWLVKQRKRDEQMNVRMIPVMIEK